MYPSFNELNSRQFFHVYSGSKLQLAAQSRISQFLIFDSLTNDTHNVLQKLLNSAEMDKALTKRRTSLNWTMTPAAAPSIKLAAIYYPVVTFKIRSQNIHLSTTISTFKRAWPGKAQIMIFIHFLIGLTKDEIRAFHQFAPLSSYTTHGVLF